MCGGHRSGGFLCAGPPAPFGVIFWGGRAAVFPPTMPGARERLEFRNDLIAHMFECE